MNTIKRILEQKGLTQTWLAAQLGKSFNMVNSYAQNRRQPSVELLYQMAHVLDVDVRDLLISNKNTERQHGN
ncbi:helix-turn-helix transcriptional regulator [Flaviaesturariibacter aridisoli]|uniref:XRE family transcriptional regulator n=1 Tax=Flaviaesturariibacter aridisoli TaxID=2545761 RepID=A0A4R4DRP2_9BACT|nr:helix-turn-helix transcriptional regulator [Flaviaesturariibacter aridisoli]TCZ65182.1 XRE family transcriptional regulator [Flaviaesturariibacter aridisoli]